MKKNNLITFAFLLLFSLMSHFVSAQTVYVSEKGKKYHKKNCAIVNEGKKGMELAEAKKAGYTPCASCKPEEKDAQVKKTDAAADKPKTKKK